MKKFAYAAALGAIVACGAASAQTPLPAQMICAIAEVADCDAGTPCVRGRPLQMGAPGMLSIDLQGKKINGPRRSTPILFIERSDETPQVLLQGTEIGFGWTLAIDMKSGSMTGTLTNREGVFLLFGTCNGVS